MMTHKSVAILGGGVAGLSAAQELAERGFQVEVFEQRRNAGGKARSIEAYDPEVSRVSASPGTRLPGEHGFRFFPGFYKHVIDTMARIPLKSGLTVKDNLVGTTQVRVARCARSSVYYPARFPQSCGEVVTALRFLVGMLASELDISPPETLFFTEKLFQILSSCKERRDTEYEGMDWSDFIDASEHSEGYRSLFADGFTRSLVAAKADRASAKTVGNITIQMLLSSLTPGDTVDRVLNGPTSDVWIRPWIEHLSSLGVRFHFDAQVQAFECAGGSITSARIRQGGRIRDVRADYFVAALPVERMAELSNEDMLRAEPKLNGLNTLTQSYLEWMNGIQFYLREDVPLVHGHTIFLKSKWALTAVSQAQFWRGYDLSRYGNGKVRGILSVCISDWDSPGLEQPKIAEACTREEIRDEVWKQMKHSLNIEGDVLRDDMIEDWFLDPAIQDTDPQVPGMETNAEPLLVNYKNTWKLRPDAVTQIANLFLASDYVRTHTDLATMEAANEAARHAVNGILDACGWSGDRCAIWPLREPEVLQPLRQWDLRRHEQGLPWDGRLAAVAHQALTVVNDVENLIAQADPDGTARAGLLRAADRLSQGVSALLGTGEGEPMRATFDEMFAGAVADAPGLDEKMAGNAGGPTGPSNIRIIV